MPSKVDTVRRACAAWGTGDISVYREMYAPDVTAFAGMLAPELPDGKMTGVDQVMETLQSLMETFESSELIPEEFIEEGEHLVVPVLMHAIPRGTSEAIDWRLAVAYTFRGGLIARQAWYPTLEEALDSVGIPRSAAGPPAA